jgi:hypothetical protein
MFSFSFEFRPRPPGLDGTSFQPATAVSPCDGQAKGRRLPLAESGLGSLTGTAAGLLCAVLKALVAGADEMGEGKPGDPPAQESAVLKAAVTVGDEGAKAWRSRHRIGWPAARRCGRG